MRKLARRAQCRGVPAGRLFTQARTYPAASQARPPTPRSARHACAHPSLLGRLGLLPGWLPMSGDAALRGGAGGRMGRLLRTRRG